MAIKKVTIADLEAIRGGMNPADKIKRSEKRAVKELSKTGSVPLIPKNSVPRPTSKSPIKPAKTKGI